ncbi:MAG: hypothetical protein QM655_11030 [Nocardioidaceae bacterium]
MSPAAKLAIGLIALAVVLGILNVPWWAIVLIVVAVPAAGYAMLDSGQKARLKRIAGRKRR